MRDHGENASGSTTADLKQKVSEDIQSVTDFANREATVASEKAKEAATDQKNILANKLGGVAEAMEKVAAELDNGDNRDIGKLTKNLGANLRNVSESIGERSLSEIAGMAEDFGRKQPLAFKHGGDRRSRGQPVLDVFCSKVGASQKAVGGIAVSRRHLSMPREFSSEMPK